MGGLTRARSFGVAGLLAMTSPAMAYAEERRDPVAADYLFREARKAARAHDYAKACPLFKDSLRLDPGAGVLMNLADCEEHLGNVASAWQHWREALDTMHGSMDKRASLAQRKIAALEKRLPRLTLRLDPGAPADTVVERDGAPLGASALGLPVPVDPGAHTIVVRAPGHADRTFSITLREAEAATQPLGIGAARPERAVAAAPPPPPAAADVSRGRASPGGAVRPIGYALVGVGAVGLGVGAITGVMALGKKSTVQQHCQADPAGGVACADQTGLDAAASGRTLSGVSTIGFAAGAACAALGIVLLVTSGGKSAAPTTGLSPRVLPGGAALAFEGAF